VKLKKLLKNKLAASLLFALIVNLGSFKLSLFIISFVIMYVLLWGYDNPEERDTYK
jgi:hypothetical protein